MASFAPFETLPQLAVAVSGGPDSLALVHLADLWARRRGGSAVALIVDHRLRPESGREAHRVAGWMAAAGISRRILRAGEPLPEANIQDWARDARYALLSAACRRAGILHLLTAHHRDDQAETLLLRLGRGSGLDGLSAMAPVVELTDCRLLRPFLPVAKSELIGWLRSKGLEWIDDPGFFGPTPEGSSYNIPRAMYAHAISNQIETARKIFADWIADHKVEAYQRIVALAVLGDREGANHLATELDALMGGSLSLSVAVQNCYCGAPFDLDATPNFKARIEESGLPWPPPAPIDFPAKKW